MSEVKSLIVSLLLAASVSAKSSPNAHSAVQPGFCPSGQSVNHLNGFPLLPGAPDQYWGLCAATATQTEPFPQPSRCNPTDRYCTGTVVLSVTTSGVVPEKSQSRPQSMSTKASAFTQTTSSSSRVFNTSGNSRGARSLSSTRSISNKNSNSSNSHAEADGNRVLLATSSSNSGSSRTSSSETRTAIAAARVTLNELPHQTGAMALGAMFGSPAVAVKF